MRNTKYPNWNVRRVPRWALTVPGRRVLFRFYSLRAKAMHRRLAYEYGGFARGVFGKRLTHVELLALVGNPLHPSKES